MNTVHNPARQAQLETLREDLRRRFPAAHLRPNGAVVQTGVHILDAWRIQEGTITEIVSLSPSMGSGTLISAILDAAGRRQTHFVALIDGLDAFDPARYGPRVLRRILWVRCRTMEDVTVATDWIARDGNFPLILVDLQLALHRDVMRLPASTWTRLSLVAEQSRVAILAITPCKCIAPAALRLQLGPPQIHPWSGKGGPLSGDRVSDSGMTPTPFEGDWTVCLNLFDPRMSGPFFREPAPAARRTD